MKGFGLRAASDIPSYVVNNAAADMIRGSLIYEYLGEVVAEKTFRRRMQDYATKGIRHFYFMMLQKDEVGHRGGLMSNIG